MGRRQLARVPQAEFDRLASKTMLGPDARQAAEDVMVHGLSMAAAGRRWTERARTVDPSRRDVSYQQVQMAINSIRRHQDLQTERQSTIELTLQLPGVIATALADLAPKLASAEPPLQSDVTAYLEISLEAASQMLDAGGD